MQHLLVRDPRVEVARHQTSTKWMIRRITNISFHIYNILAMGKIGKPNKCLPHDIMTNRAMEKTRSESVRGQTVYVSLPGYGLGLVKWKCECKGPSERKTNSLCEDYLIHVLPAYCGEDRFCHMIVFLRYISENGCIDFAIRKDTAMTCIETESLRFLDVNNYVAPGFFS